MQDYTKFKNADGGHGAVVTGDAIKDMTTKDIVELITNYLL